MGRIKVVQVLSDFWQVEELRDEWKFDTVNITNGTSVARFFLSIAGKNDAQGEFEGDKAIVQDGRIYQMKALYAYAQAMLLSDQIQKQIFDLSFHEIKVSNFTIEKDLFKRLQPGIDSYKFVGGGNIDPTLHAVGGTGNGLGIRTFDIPKCIPGGRALDFEIQWPFAGGLVLPAGLIVPMQIHIYGMELIPTEQQPAQNALESQYRRQIESGAGY